MSLERMIIGLLGAVVSLLAYWAVRLENRVEGMAEDIDDTNRHMAEQYVRRDDCRQTHADVRDHLAKIERKLDRLIERNCA